MRQKPVGAQKDADKIDLFQFRSSPDAVLSDRSTLEVELLWAISGDTMQIAVAMSPNSILVLQLF